MGLFDKVSSMVGSLGDIKDLSKIQGQIEDGVKGLIDSGKCPDALKTAYENLKSSSKSGNQEASLSSITSFASALTKNKNALPDNIQKTADKYLSLIEDLKKKATDATK